jgi:hypothetical protein
MSESSSSESSCPSCRSPLSDNAVICVACGLNLKTNQFIAVDVTPSHLSPGDDSKSVVERKAPKQTDSSDEFDLDDKGVRRLTELISGASSVYWAIPLCMCCPPIYMVLIPYYSYLLFSWNRLRKRYRELQTPSSFSPNSALTSKFATSRTQLIVGIAVIFAAVAAFAVISVIRKRLLEN